MSLGASEYEEDAGSEAGSSDGEAAAAASTPADGGEAPSPAQPAPETAPPATPTAAPSPPPAAPTPAPTAAPSPPPAAAYSEPAYAAPQKQIQATPYSYKSLGPERPSDLNLNENNLELIMTVPVQITVELGKTKKKIKDIAELTVGNIVELDRQAGDQVDVVANGRLIARGDVVVVDDNYSVRITEIVKSKETASEAK